MTRNRTATLLRDVGPTFLFLFILACASEGPLGFIPGGPFSGILEESKPGMDWSFATDVDSVDVQVGGPQGRTVRTGFIIYEGKPYLPVTWSPLKRWPETVREEPRIVVRVGERLFALAAKPVEDQAHLEALRKTGQSKYGAPFHAQSLSGYTSYFKLLPDEKGPP